MLVQPLCYLFAIQHEVFYCRLLQVQSVGHQTEHILVPCIQPCPLVLAQGLRTSLDKDSFISYNHIKNVSKCKHC